MGARRGGNQLSCRGRGCGIEVGQLVVRFPFRRAQFVAPTDVYRQLPVHAPVVLCVRLVQPLVDVGDVRVVEFVVAARAEEEIGQAVCLVGQGRADAACRLAGRCPNTRRFHILDGSRRRPR